MFCGFCICPGRGKLKTQSCLQSSMKLLPGEFTFGDMCVFVWVCMREKEREGNYSSTLGETGHKFCWTLKGPLKWEFIYQAHWPLRPPVSQSGYLKPLAAPRVPRSILSCPKHPTAPAVLKSRPSSTTYHMCDLSKALAVWTSVSSYVSWANQITCCVGVVAGLKQLLPESSWNSLWI